MKVRDIQIDGFGVWSGLSVDSMPEGMTVFYGPNEAGKTTLMNFLRTMLYGFTADRRQRYLPPVFPGKPGGAMRVSGPGGGYEIARRATLNDPSIVGQLTVTSSDGVTQGQHRLTSLLGSVDESIFTNVFAIGLRELQELSTLDDTAAADELYKLSSGLDRVSLVDVMRQLKSARGHLVANSVENGQVSSMMAKREKLRDELEQLTVRGRRWGELAAHRKNQQNEIDELKLRVDQWELEAKAVETALQVKDPWIHRDLTRSRLKALHARVDVPENAVDKLREIQEQIDDKRRQIQSVKEERSQVRRRATDMPVSKGILSLAGKIEAAGEQGPWIASLQKQIQRLESDFSQTQQQLVEDAKRLGLSEADQTALLNDKRLANMPDLSRQAISQLAGPAREVRVHQTRLKQAKQQGLNDKKEAERLASEINEFLSIRGEDDLQKAHKNCNDLLLSLRKSQNLEERIDKLVKHKREIETDAVSLESDEGLPIDHVIHLALPFIMGSMALVTGMGKFFGWQWTASTTPGRVAGQLATSMAEAAAKTHMDQNYGLLLFVFGIVVLIGTYLYWKRLEQGSRTDLRECDSRLEAMNIQLRKSEEERNELLTALPEHGGSLEQRIREAEHSLEQCESYLPVHHNWQAAMQRYKTAKQHGMEAASGLKSARSQWRKTLAQLGLADSLSPKSIRILAEGYESLLQTKRRLTTQQDELDQRKLELSTSLQRIEALSMQLKVAIDDSNNDAPDPERRSLLERVEQSRESGNSNTSKNAERDRRDARDRRDQRDHRDQRNRDEQLAIRAASAAAQTGDGKVEGPILKLQELSNTLAQHQQYITQRRQLRTEDEELAKKQKSLQRLMDRWIRARQAHLADLGVEDQQQLEEQLSLKHQYLKLQDEIADLDSRVSSIIGGHVPYESIARLLENAPPGELEKRWETLGQRIQQAEERVSQLLQRQGETFQEMKSLAADRRLAEAKLELASLEKQIAACSEHWRILGATTCMLEKVCEVYETERQPETLREASAFLKQLTDGKYVRVWTPLGKNALRIDNEKNQS
ncbi:MAG: AAA family ATPase, partial [Pirellula sp.]